MMKSKRLRIAVTALAWHDHGGIERCVLAECAWMAAAGHEVHVFAGSFEGPAPKGVAFHPVALPSRPWVLRMSAFAGRSAEAVRRAGRFDVVHTHAVYAGKGHIAHAHSVHPRALAFDRPAEPLEGLKWWLKGMPPLVLWHVDRSFRQAGLCLAISRGIRQELEEEYAVPDDRLSLLYYGVESAHFRPLAAAPRRALRKRLGMGRGVWAAFCGWNWRRKGLDVLFKALQDAEGVNLAVVGEDPAEGRFFREEARRSGLAERVKFVGRQSDPLPWFQAADLFAFPTRYEPFGMVVSEAMACGLPVLVPREAGASEVVDTGRGLQVLPSAEDAGALAKGLRALRDKPALARSLGVANRRVAARMLWSRHGAQLEKIYRRVAAGSRA